MQTEVRVLSKPIKKSAREIYQELKLWLQQQQLDVIIHKIILNFDNQSQINKIYQYWNPKIQQSINTLQADPRIVAKIEPKLLNENKTNLSIYLDYCQLIEDILIKPQEDLFTVPQWQPIIRKQNPCIDNDTKQCQIYFYGNDIDKFKKYDEERNQCITLFGQQYYLKQCNQRSKMINQYTTLQLKGSEIQFGFFNQKFFSYWSTKQIYKYYSNNQVIVDEMRLCLNNSQAILYFDLVIDTQRRVHFKIQFQTSKAGTPKIVQNNTTSSNGGIIVDKSKEDNEIYFYVRVTGTPKCFIYENIQCDKFQHQKDIKFWRCQNFLHNDVINLIQACIIKQFSYLRFSVDYQKTQNLGFLKFCEEIEKSGYLNRYAGDQHILLRRFSDFLSNNYTFQVRLSLNWMIVSSVLGRQAMLSPYFNFESFIDSVKEQNPSQLAFQIKSLLLKKQDKKDKELFQPEKFIDIITKNAAKNPDNKFEEILLADLTPTGLTPNYSIQEYIPLNSLEIIVQKIIRGKNSIKQNQLDQEIIKVRLRDESFEQFKTSRIDKTNRNQILISSHFRLLLKNRFQILGREFMFFAYDERSLKRAEFYLINHLYFQPAYSYFFKNLIKNYNDNQNTVRCSQIQTIFNEHFNFIYGSLDLNQIQEKLFEERVENQSQVQNTGPLLSTKIDTKIPNRQLKSENSYNYRVLMQQGKVSSDIMKCINQIIFEDTDYCCFIIRYQDFKGVITQMKNPSKSSSIVFYDSMKQKYSPFAEQSGIFEQQSTRFEKKNAHEIQILGIPEYKPCLLKIYQILNILRIEAKTGTNQIINTFKKYYYQFKNAKSDDNPPTFYSKVQNLINPKKEFKLPIEGGAYLMGVYDNRLDPDEVFIQIQTDMKSKIQLVKGKKVIIFKKNYLREDGIHLFRIPQKEKKEQLAKIYKNVIVFSAHMICSKFPFDCRDDKQKFIAIWDQHLIPLFEQPQLQFDAKEEFKNLKYKIQKNQSIASSLLSKSQQEEDWLRCIQEQMIDYFCLFQQDNILEDLKQIYTKLLLYTRYYEINNELKKDLPRLLDQIKVHNLIGLWFSHCQARKQNFKNDLMQWYKEVSKEILDSEQMIDKLFSK